MRMAVSLGLVLALIKKFGGGGGGGGVTDVKVNGVSVVSGGKADIPVAASNGQLGVITIDSYYGVNTNANGRLYVNGASESQLKGGSQSYAPVVALNQHISAFYGLAKAAGTDMANSSNAVGVYTEDAKSAISQMLDAPESVSGTTPSITGKAGVRYICGEVSTISITPSVSGAIDVVFTSGSTPAVLTVPSTVKFPAWFDYENLEANKTYEINILDGVYGVVTAWA